MVSEEDEKENTDNKNEVFCWNFSGKVFLKMQVWVNLHGMSGGAFVDLNVTFLGWVDGANIIGWCWLNIEKGKYWLRSIENCMRWKK